MRWACRPSPLLWSLTTGSVGGSGGIEIHPTVQRHTVINTLAGRHILNAAFGPSKAAKLAAYKHNEQDAVAAWPTCWDFANATAEQIAKANNELVGIAKPPKPNSLVAIHAAFRRHFGIVAPTSAAGGEGDAVNDAQ